MLNFLKNEGVSLNIIAEIERFRANFSVEGGLSRRIPVPRYLYYGKDIWEEAITALLCGENLLLVGPKATGKNVLAENLAAVFGRPSWDVSFYINTDAATLLGTDTFSDGAVTLRKGPIYQCAEYGGFGILDEINMAKNESLAVLHATLDFRRCIDMPGYDRIPMHDATRFIATMNYGYAGTRELNEALASRFVVIDMPAITTDGLIKLLCREYPKLRHTYAEQFAGLEFLNPSKKVRYHLYDSLQKLGIPRKLWETTAIQKLSAVGFEQPESVSDKYPFQLSGGMAQRVTIAISACSRAKLVIADEPTNGLDHEAKVRFMDMLKKIFPEAAKLIITHDIGVAALCDKTLVLCGGKTVETGPSDVLLCQPKHPYTTALVGALVKNGMRETPVLRSGRHDCPFYTKCVQADESCSYCNKQDSNREWWCSRV